LNICLAPESLAAAGTVSPGSSNDTANAANRDAGGGEVHTIESGHWDGGISVSLPLGLQSGGKRPQMLF
jgi:hypothetical protein